MLCGMSNKGFSYVGNWYSQGTTDAGTPANWNSAADGSGVTASSSDFTTAGNTWNIQSAMTLSENWTVAGSIVITSTGNFNPSSTVLIFTTQYNVTLGGSWTNNGTFTCGTGTVTFNGTTAGNTLSGNMTVSNEFYNLTFDGGGAWSFGGNAADVAGNFTITLGTVTAPSTTLQVAGNFVHTAGTFAHNNGTVNFNGNGAQAMPGTATAFYNFNITNTAGTVTANAVVTVNATMSSSAGANLNMVTNQLLGTPSASTFNGTLATQCANNPAIPNGATWGGTVNCNGTSGSIYIAYGTYNNLTVTTTSGARAFQGATTVSGNLAIGSSSITTGVVTLGGNLAVGGNVTITSTSSNNIFSVSASNYQITVGGNWTVFSTTATSVFNAGTGKVIFNGTAAQTISSSGGSAPPNFYNFENSNTSNTLTTGSNTTIAGTLTNDAGATLSPGSTTLTVGGSWANNGSFAAGTSTIIMNAATTGNTLSGSMTGSNAFNNLTFNGIGGAWSFGANSASIGGNFTMTVGTLTAPSTTLQVAGNFVHTAGIFTHNNGTVNFNGSVAQAMPASATSFYNLNITNTGGTITANAVVTVNATLSSPAGAKLNMGTYQLLGTPSASTFNGTLATQVVSGQAIPNGETWGGTVNYNGTTGTMYVAYGTYNNLTVSTTSLACIFQGVTTVIGNLAIGSSSTTTGATTLGGNLTVGGNVTITGTTSNNIFSASASNYQITVGGNWTVASTTATSLFNGGSGKVIFNGTGSQTISSSGGSALPGFYNLENSNTGNTLTLANNTAIGGTLTNDAGAALSLGTTTLTVTGSWANNGSINAGTSTVIMNATGAGITLTGNMTGSNAFYNLTFNTSGGGWSFGANPADVGGNLTIGTGTVTAPSTNLNIAGNFVHNGGTFNHNNGTVTFNGTGAQTFPGSAGTTFYSLNVTNTSGTVTAILNTTAAGTLSSVAGANLNMSTYQLLGLTSASGFNGTLQTQNASNPALPNGITWGGTIIYNSTTAVTGVSYGTYNNLTISSTTYNKTFSPGVTTVNGNLSVTSTSGVVTLNGNLTVAGNITINSTTTANIFDVSSGNYQINAGGNWTQSSTAGTNPFNTRAGNVVFNGTSSQTISTSAGTSVPTFYNLSITNTSNPVIAGSNISVNNVLTLGNLTLGANNLFLGTGASISGASPTNYIYANSTGLVEKSFSSAGSFTYPVGDAASNYTPITLSVSGASYPGGNYVGVAVNNSKPSNNQNTTNYLSRYWIVGVSGITSPSYSVTNANYVPGDVNGTEANIYSGEYTGALPWVKFSGVNTATHSFSTTAVNSANAIFTGINGVAGPDVSVTPSTGYCAGSNAALSASGTTGDATLSYVWAPATGLSATTGVNVIATPTVATTYTLTVTDGNGFISTATTTVSLSPNPAITATVTPGAECTGGAISLYSTPSGGSGVYASFYWNGPNSFSASSQNTYINGITGAAAGVYSIMVTDVNGCTGSAVTSILTVNPLPSISGSLSICSSSGTTTLSTSTTGGTWYSVNSGVATIGSASGIVTGVTPGTATIGYTIGCGTDATVVVTVNGTNAISGGGVACVGNTISLSDATTGGIWQSSATGVATIGTNGTVAGVAGGTANISYTLSGCSSSITVTINALPSISGSGTACMSGSTSSTTLAGSPTGGTWLSSTTSIATIGSSSGLINGLANGTAIITYTLATTGCINTTTETVAGGSAILGNINVCNGGGTTSLSDAVSGGAWSSSATGVATINGTTGIVTGVSVGTTTISYALGGCYQKTTIVSGAAPTAIGGTPLTLCSASSTGTLTETTAGGTWSSSNTAIATVSSSGTSVTVTGVNGGTTTISYTTGCGTGPSTVVTVGIAALPWLETFEGYAVNTINCNELLSPVDGTYGNVSTGTAANVQTYASTDPSEGYTSTSTQIPAYAGTQLMGFGFFADNDFFYTPGFNLTSGNTYQFSYYYRTDGNGGNGDYNTTMYYNTSQTSSGATAFQAFSVAVTSGVTAALTKGNLVNFNNTTYQQWTGYFTPATSGVYYFIVNAQVNNDLNTYYFGMDNVGFKQTSSCVAPAAATTVTATPAHGTETNITVTATAADSFLTVAMLATNTPSGSLSNGTNYSVGTTVLGSGVIIAKGIPAIATAASTGYLVPGNNYKFYTYTYAHDSCNGIAYSAASASIATFTTCSSSTPFAPTVSGTPGLSGAGTLVVSGLPTDAGGIVTLYAWTNAAGTTAASPASYSVPSLSATYTVTSVSSGTNLWFSVAETLAGCTAQSPVSAEGSVPFALPWNQNFETSSSKNQMSPNYMQGNLAEYIDQTSARYGGEDNNSGATGTVGAHGGTWDYLFMGGLTAPTSSPGTGAPYISITADPNQWLVTPGLYCPSAGQYNLSFWYYNYAGFPNSIIVQYSNIPTLPGNLVNSMTSATTVTTVNPSTTGTWTQVVVPITITSGPQTIFVGLDVQANSSSYFMAFDDIEVCETPTVTVTNGTVAGIACANGSVTLTGAPNPVASLTSGTWNYTWAGPGTVTSTGANASGTALTSVGTNPVYTVSISNSGDTWSHCASAPVTTIATITPVPTAVTGAASICGGATSIYSGGATAGTPGWSITGTGSSYASGYFTSGYNITTSNPSSQQTISINYSNGCGTSTPLTVTINVQPAAITGGSSTVCTLNATPAFTDITGGGVWSTATTTYGTISPTTGIFTSKNTSGIATISYTETVGGCVSTTPINVDVTGPISLTAGTNPICN